MNLIEARKLAHEGWVRSPSRTNNNWICFTGKGSYLQFEESQDARQRIDITQDLDAEDWEPKPKPAEPRESDVWVSPNGWALQMDYVVREQDAQDDTPTYAARGWRKIRVREVVE